MTAGILIVNPHLKNITTMKQFVTCSVFVPGR